MITYMQAPHIFGVGILLFLLLFCLYDKTLKKVFNWAYGSGGLESVMEE